MLLVMTAVAATAGTWKMHNYYVTSKIQNVFDTGDKVYYLNSNALFEFDKATQTTTALNSQNRLSDNSIDQIYYDDSRNLLFVVYTSANIDVIDATNGSVTNISSVKDAITRVYCYTLTSGVLTAYNDKKIYSITFADGKAYAATGYGYVCIDESTLRVVKNKVLSETLQINGVTVLGNGTMVIITNSFCYYGPADAEDPIKTFKRHVGTDFTDGKIWPIDDHSVFALGRFALFNLDFSSETVAVTTLVSSKPTSVQRTPTGFIANFAGQSFYYTIDATGKTATKASSVVGFASSYPQGDGTVWINDADGLHIENDATAYKINSMTTNEPYWLKYNPYMNLLYVGISARNGNTNTKVDPANVINTYDGHLWEDATAYVSAGAGYEFVFNPLDSTTYFRASWNSGLHKVTNNVLKLTYNATNSMIGKRKPSPAFDNYGNLWVVCSYGNSSCPTAVLPKDKVAKNTVAKTDWFQPAGLLSLATGYMQRSRFLVSKLTNVKIYTDGDYLSSSMIGRILCWDNFNEDPTVDDYRFTSISHFIDQENKQVDWQYLSHMEQDADGMIWVGHTGGLFVFNPNVVFDETPRAIRPVTANFDEGKGYLCEGYSVYDIGIDRHNNKWIGTNNGLYFVSPDGTTVFEHFMTTNSDIPSDMVYSVECDPVHDRVYIYTDNGFAEYITYGDAAALNLDNVYAFPNPVEPGFTGMIKIANLMENTYVTITDHDGNIVAQLGPVMGSALWDGAGADGERLPTGTYNIYAAEGAQPVTTGTPQAVVMIIK